MAFRKFGGLEYNKKNNYVSSNINNNINLNITDQIGHLNTKIVTKSHLDLDGQTMFNVGNIIFVNGLDLEQMLGSITLSNEEALKSIFVSNNNWLGVNTFVNDTVLSIATITVANTDTAMITSASIEEAVITKAKVMDNFTVGSNCEINNNGNITCSSLNATTGDVNIETGGLKVGTTCEINNNGNITCSSLNATTGDVNIETGGLTVGTIYGMLSTGAITGSSLNATTGDVNIETGGLTVGTIYGMSSTGAITGSSLNATTGDVNIETGGLTVGTIYGMSSTGAITCNSLTVTGTSATINGQNIATTLSDTSSITIYNSPYGVTGSTGTTLTVTSVLSNNLNTNTISFPSTILNGVQTGNQIAFTMNFPSPIYPSNAVNPFMATGLLQVSNSTQLYNLQIIVPPSTSTYSGTLTSSQIYCTSGGTVAQYSNTSIYMDIVIQWS